MTKREALHKLIDEWPENELESLEELFRAGMRARAGGLRMRETTFTDEEVEDVDVSSVKPISDEEFRRILDEAPLDDEPETDEEREAVRLSLLSRPEDRIPHEALMKRLGL